MAKFVCFNEIIVYFTDDPYEWGRPSGGGEVGEYLQTQKCFKNLRLLF